MDVTRGPVRVPSWVQWALVVAALPLLVMAVTTREPVAASNTYLDVVSIHEATSGQPAVVWDGHSDVMLTLMATGTALSEATTKAQFVLADPTGAPWGTLHMSTSPNVASLVLASGEIRTADVPRVINGVVGVTFRVTAAEVAAGRVPGSVVRSTSDDGATWWVFPTPPSISWTTLAWLRHADVVPTTVRLGRPSPTVTVRAQFDRPLGMLGGQRCGEFVAAELWWEKEGKRVTHEICWPPGVTPSGTQLEFVDDVGDLAPGTWRLVGIRVRDLAGTEHDNYASGSGYRELVVRPAPAGTPPPPSPPTNGNPSPTPSTPGGGGTPPPEPAPGGINQHLAVSRVAGPDRYQTAVAASQDAYPSGAAVVYLATGENFPDALTAGPAAWVEGGPVLLSPGDHLDPHAAAEIRRLGAPRVVLCGGERALSSAVEEAVAALGVTVERRAGDTRYDTASLIARHAFEGPAAVVFVATGENFPDATVAAAAAADARAPLLLAALRQLPGSTAEELTRLTPAEILITGDDTTIDDRVRLELERFARDVGRMEGPDRYATAAAVAERRFPFTVGTVFLAVGSTFPDALSAVSPAARRQSPLLLTNGTCLTPHTEAAMAKLGAQAVTIMGDTSVVKESAPKTRC